MNHDLERELREAEARFQTLVEEMPAIIYINAWDEPHATLYVSPHVEEVLGYPTACWLEQPGFVYAIIHSNDRERLRQESARTRAIGARLSMEYRLIARDGREIWVRDERVPVYDTDGYPLFYQGIMLDVSDRRHVEEALRASEERFRGAFEDAAVALGIATLDGQLLRVNAAHCDLLGYTESELLASDVAHLIHPDDLANTLQRREALLSGAIRSYRQERRYLHKDGHVVWGLVSLSLTRDLDGKPLTILAQIQDISDRKLAEAALRESEEFFRSTFDDAGIAMGVSDLSLRLLRVNQPHCRLLGYSEAELLAIDPARLMDAESWAAQERMRIDLLQDRTSTHQMERRYLHKDGHVVWGLVNLSLVYSSDGHARYFLSQVQDITDRKELEARLTHQAFHDSLTGLPNRALLHDRIDHALARANRNGETIAVIFIDLDGFKAVNDTYGHATGDQLLIAIGARLRGWVRAGDTVARLGGDEFTILLEEIGTRETATRIADRIIAGLETPVPIEGRNLSVRASLGIAFNRPADILPDDVLRDADIALYRAKRFGGNQYTIHDEDSALPQIGTTELRANYH